MEKGQSSLTETCADDCRRQSFVEDSAIRDSDAKSMDRSLGEDSHHLPPGEFEEGSSRAFTSLRNS